MKAEERNLLLKDLCARLPYGVFVKDDMGRTYKLEIGNSYLIDLFYNNGDYVNVPIKPFLHPMSSMTEEESAKLSNIIGEWFDKELFYLTEEPFLEYALSRINYSISPLLFDWLNAHHFDYRGLIGKDLAIEVTKENNPYKN